jgi:hypothetical protein
LLVNCGTAPRELPRPVSAPHEAAPRSAPATQPAANAVSPAPLLVVIIVDQLAEWVMNERLASMSAHGAFARLRREGLFVHELRYEHATTSTAPGHAALFSGLPPRESGIYANERLDPRSHKAVSILADDATRLVADPSVADSSSSAAIMRGATLADALREQAPNAWIVSISLKDRAAIFGGGRHPTFSIWFDVERGAFVTSSAFASELPSWVTERRNALERARVSRWEPLDPAWLRGHAPTDDDQAGEGDLGAGTHFPYDLSLSKAPNRVFRGTPIADDTVLDLGLAALATRRPEQPALLVLSLSAFDYVGHVTGPESWESWETLRRLDLKLASFLEEAERLSRGRFSVLLTADHGAPPLPETASSASARPWCQSSQPDYFERPCDAGGRLYRDELEHTLRLVARAALGKGDWIEGVVEPFVYFTPAVAALPPARRAKLEAACGQALARYPEVARSFTKSDRPASCPEPADQSLEALVCRSLPDNAGDLYIATRPGSFFDPNLARGRGVNHGSPYLFDRTVPLFVRGADLNGAGREQAGPVRPADFTATAAARLGIQPPAGAATGRDLLSASR